MYILSGDSVSKKPDLTAAVISRGILTPAEQHAFTHMFG